MDIQIGQKVVLKDGRFIGVLDTTTEGGFVGQFNKDSQIIGFTESDVLGVTEFTQHSNSFVQKLIDLKNGLIRHSFVVSREGELNTVAIVSFKALVHMPADQAKAKLIEAITRWIVKTREGKDAWIQSGQNFNIWDLAGYIGDPILMIEISAAGLEEFYICIMSGGAMGWSHDIILVDRDKLKDADVLGESLPLVDSVPIDANEVTDPIPDHQPGPDSVWNKAEPNNQ